MKRLMAAAAALSLMAGTSALAADPPQHDHGAPPAGGSHSGGSSGGSHSGGSGGSHSGGAGAGASHGSAGGGGAGAGGGSGGPHAYVAPGRNDTPHPQGGSAPAPGPVVTHQGRPGFGAPGFAAGATDRPRYDPQHFPRQVRAKQHFGWKGAQAWNNQPGWYAHHWGYGDYLPVGWFATDFWINDYDDYDLPVPPYGYEWVRSGPDALLVDTYTGEVVEAVYGLF